MYRPVTVKEIQRLDKLAIERYGIPSLVLMENAGRAVAGEVTKYLRKKRRSRVCIVCGAGNNGGDGFVVARHLINAGILTKTFLVGKADQLKRDAAVNFRILEKLKCPVRKIVSENEVARADCVVDAIFGVGLDREITGPFRGIIEAINRSAKHVIAVDVPSGLDGTTGKIYGVCVKADKTVTFSFPKKGFYKREGPKHTGKVVVADIGIPPRLKNEFL